MQPTRLDGKPYTKEEIEGMYKLAIKREDEIRHNKYKVDDKSSSDDDIEKLDNVFKHLEKGRD